MHYTLENFFRLQNPLLETNHQISPSSLQNFALFQRHFHVWCYMLCHCYWKMSLCRWDWGTNDNMIVLRKSTPIHVQCRHLISAPNAWAARAKYTTSSPIATQVPEYGCMDNFRTELRFDLQSMWVINVLCLFFDMFIHGWL